MWLIAAIVVLVVAAAAVAAYFLFIRDNGGKTVAKPTPNGHPHDDVLAQRLGQRHRHGQPVAQPLRLGHARAGLRLGPQDRTASRW